jgi:cytoskeleton protein RodZ
VSSETGHSQGSRRLNLKEVKEAPGVSDESIGMELRAMRLQRGETIAQISQVLRIRKDLVEAIEHSRHDLLPGQAYAVGFVRSYADYLRLDTPDVIRRYKAEMAALEPEGHFAIMVPEEEQRFNFVSVGVILLCLLAAGVGAWYLATQAGWIGGSRPLTPVTAEPEGTSTTPPPESLDPGASTAPPAAAVAPPPVAAPVPPPVEVPPPPPPRPGGIVAPGPGETAQPATGTIMGKSNADARIVFIARRETLLTVESTELRNTVYINRTLKPGDSYRVPNKGGLSLSIADAGAIDVIVDGTFIGRAGMDDAPVAGFALSPEAYGAPAERPAAVPAAEQPPEAMPEDAPADPAPVPEAPAAAPPATPPASGTPD